MIVCEIIVVYIEPCLSL